MEDGGDPKGSGKRANHDKKCGMFVSPSVNMNELNKVLNFWIKCIFL